MILLYLRNYTEERFLNIFRGIRFAAPAAVYLALFLNNPAESGGGIEVNYSGYERIPIEFTEPAYDPTLMSYAMKNLTEAAFAKSSVAAGTVTHIGIYDSKLSGNMLLYGTLDDPITIEAGESPVIVPEEIIYMSTGNMSEMWKSKLFNLFRGNSVDGVTPYLALLNNDTELIAANYNRQPIVFAEPHESETGIMTIENASTVMFNRASTAWGIYNQIAIMTSPTGGEVIWKKSRGSDRTVPRLKTVQFNIGDIRIGVN